MTEDGVVESTARGPEGSIFPSDLPLVGRQAEREILDQALDQAQTYLAPQLVIVQGERGTGKSRLVAAWAEEVTHRPLPVSVYTCRAEPGDGDRELWARLLRARFGIQSGQDPEEARAELRRQCQEVFEDRRMAEILHFLGSFMGLRYPDNPFLRLLEEDLWEHDRIAVTVLRRFLEADSKRAPLVLVMEDLHDADDASLDLLQQVGESLEGARIVIVAVCQPRLRVRRPGWGFRDGDLREITVGPLPHQDAARLLQALLRRAGQLPPAFVEDAVRMSGGNPLFLQQLLWMLAEQGILDTSRERWTLDLERFAATKLPLSVEDAIEARILALSVEERQVLEMAATLGNVFWFGALVMLTRVRIEEESSSSWASDQVADRLRGIVDALVEREYILHMPDAWIPGEEEYLFKHNLEFSLIEAALDTKRVASHHLYVAQWMESRVSAPSAEHLEFIGQQYEAGGDLKRAAFSYIHAGDLSRAKFANEQAIKSYERGIALLEPPSVLPRMEALHSLGAVCALVGRHREALGHFQEMLRLAWLLDAVSKGGAALGRIGRIHRELGEYDAAMERYQAAEALFRRSNDRRGVASILDDVGKVHFLRGEYAEALSRHKRALEMRRTMGDSRSTAFTLANLGMVFEATGEFKEALGAYEESLSIRRKIDDRIGVVESLRSVGAVFHELGEDERAGSLWDEGLELARATGDRLQEGWLLVALGENCWRRRQPEEARERLDEAEEIATALGDDRLRSRVLRVKGQLAAAAGQLEAGRDLLLQALKLAETSKDRGLVGAAERALAGLAVLRSFVHEAEERYERAMSIFSDMGNHLEVARCCEAMAAFYESTGGTDKTAKLRASAKEIRQRLLAAAGRA
ncbi:MAG: tetratricopeptide repeat protein [Polyangia bacterium]|jgi:tetratricopeptide (TPR) repeat protein|nr:tetratricopeptide repeat protein [Polyangia bacterium]